MRSIKYLFGGYKEIDKDGIKDDTGDSTKIENSCIIENINLYYDIQDVILSHISVFKSLISDISELQNHRIQDHDQKIIYDTELLELKNHGIKCTFIKLIYLLKDFEQMIKLSYNNDLYQKFYFKIINGIELIIKSYCILRFNYIKRLHLLFNIDLIEFLDNNKCIRFDTLDADNYYSLILFNKLLKNEDNLELKSIYIDLIDILVISKELCSFKKSDIYVNYLYYEFDKDYPNNHTNYGTINNYFTSKSNKINYNDYIPKKGKKVSLIIYISLLVSLIIAIILIFLICA